ncbi:hypothetical protein CDG60_04835 [Acinetobacter chinensis]|jgi:alpha-glucosidase (family GH31 glycosyl hydrolase)|uniref:Membrane-binding protein n=1 Tax=Acinetobacter chinensis TaxID=2004650 RepID=A0A3B7M077_9GAMM|nr:hypothetical protein [Acinetobacter chinensis]AXY55963.1 hypothetical protein CDG60_04835 [Acinetobacter chinensis]
MNFKNIFCLSVISSLLFLSGCSTTQGLKSGQIPTELKSQLSSQQAIVGYFSRTENEEDCGCASQIDSTYSKTPVEDGYYRVLLGRNAKGDFLVQDFYQKTGHPQSSPAWVTDPLKLFSFDGSDVEGPVTLYYPDGKVAAKFTNKDGEAIEGEDYYTNGQLGSLFKTDDQGNSEYRLWYASGKKAVEYTLNKNQETTSSQAWNEDGSDNEDIEGVFKKIYDLLDPKFQE